MNAASVLCKEHTVRWWRFCLSYRDSPSLTTAFRFGAVVILPLVSMFGTVMMPILSMHLTNFWRSSSVTHVQQHFQLVVSSIVVQRNCDPAVFVHMVGRKETGFAA